MTYTIKMNDGFMMVACVSIAYAYILYNIYIVGYVDAHYMAMLLQEKDIHGIQSRP